MTTNPQRVALITGGNSGIGFATVTRLTALGYHVILAARNPETSKAAISRLLATQPCIFSYSHFQRARAMVRPFH